MKNNTIVKQLCIVIFTIAFLGLCQNAFARQEFFANATHKNINLADIFDNVRGTAVFYSPKRNTLEIYNKNLALTQAPPQSTFKIISTLMGLEYGIIYNKNSKMQYNGTKYWLDAWNKNVNLAEAFSLSCVWYFHQLTYKISRDKISHFLHMLKYGNEDISQWKGNTSNAKAELNGFWLSSSLKISPLEQVYVLSDIFEGKTSIKRSNITILKDIMRQSIADVQVFAKTGSNMRGKSWFVGFSKTAQGKTYFAFYVDDPKAGVSTAKEIAIKFFEKHKDLFK